MASSLAASSIEGNLTMTSSLAASSTEGCCRGSKTNLIQVSGVNLASNKNLRKLQNICHVALTIFAFYQNYVVSTAAFTLGFVIKALQIRYKVSAREASEAILMPVCAQGEGEFFMRERLGEQPRMLLTVFGVADCISHYSFFKISLVTFGAGYVAARIVFS